MSDEDNGHSNGHSSDANDANGHSNGTTSNPFSFGPRPFRPVTASFSEEKFYRERARAASIVTNHIMWRTQAIQRWLDPRRDLDFECGYPANAIDSAVYQSLYERDHLAGRVVELFPKECSQIEVQVYEDENPDKMTAWEEAFANCFDGINGVGASWNVETQGSKFHEIVTRADIQAGIGCYGIILLGIDDGLGIDQPAAMRVKKPKKPKNKKKTPRGEQSTVPDTPDTPDTLSQEPLQGPGQEAISTKTSTEYDIPMPFSTARPDERPFAYNPYRGFMPKQGDLISGKVASLSGGAIDEEALDDIYRTPPIPIPPHLRPKQEKSDLVKLKFVQVFSEHYCRVIEYDTDEASDRFGLPLRYAITFGSTMQNPEGPSVPVITRDVHWTRVVHIPSDGGFVNNEIRSFPRMQQVLNRILDCRKIYGPDAENFYKNGLPTWAFETHPEIGSPDLDKPGLKNEWEENINSTTRLIATEGGTLKPLTAAITDPKSHIEIQIEGICIKMGCPVPVFKGYEIGEQASTNNDSDWKGRVRDRRKRYNKPYIVCPLIDRLIALFCLPEPEAEDGYKAWYDDKQAQTPSEKATIASTRVTAIAEFFDPTKSLPDYMARVDFWTREMGYDEKEARAIIENAEKEKAERKKEADAIAAEQRAIDQEQADIETQRNIEAQQMLAQPEAVDPAAMGEQIGADMAAEGDAASVEQETAAAQEELDALGSAVETDAEVEATTENEELIRNWDRAAQAAEQALQAHARRYSLTSLTANRAASGVMAKATAAEILDILRGRDLRPRVGSKSPGQGTAPVASSDETDVEADRESADDPVDPENPEKEEDPDPLKQGQHGSPREDFRERATLMAEVLYATIGRDGIAQLVNSPVLNIFCPTGRGGGIKPDCKGAPKAAVAPVQKVGGVTPQGHLQRQRQAQPQPKPQQKKLGSGGHPGGTQGATKPRPEAKEQQKQQQTKDTKEATKGLKSPQSKKHQEATKEGEKAQTPRQQAKAQQAATTKDQIRELAESLKGRKATPQESEQMLKLVMSLNTKQLREIRHDYNVKGSGWTKEDLTKKLVTNLIAKLEKEQPSGGVKPPPPPPLPKPGPQPKPEPKPQPKPEPKPEPESKPPQPSQPKATLPHPELDPNRPSITITDSGTSILGQIKSAFTGSGITLGTGQHTLKPPTSLKDLDHIEAMYIKVGPAAKEEMLKYFNFRNKFGFSPTEIIRSFEFVKGLEKLLHKNLNPHDITTTITNAPKAQAALEKMQSLGRSGSENTMAYFTKAHADLVKQLAQVDPKAPNAEHQRARLREDINFLKNDMRLAAEAATKNVKHDREELRKTLVTHEGANVDEGHLPVPTGGSLLLKTSMHEARQFLDKTIAPDHDGKQLPGLKTEHGVDPSGDKYRANYDYTATKMHLDKHDETYVVIHEYGHHIENRMPGVLAASREFLQSRIAGEAPTNLKEKFGGKFEDYEVGYKDDFDKTFRGSSAYYAGKSYGTYATEVVSMGVQKMYENPSAFAKQDPEYFKFIHGLLTGETRRREIPSGY